MSQVFPRALRVFLLLSGGALLATALPPLSAALAAPGVPLMWWSARALGLVAVLSLWLSVLFGVFVADRGAGGLLPSAMTVRLHTRWALAAQVATALHVLFVVVDPVSGVTALAAIVPLTSATLTGPVALGTFALWGFVVLLVSTALARRISKRAWRAIHRLAFGTFSLAIVHGITAGTDTRSPVIRWMYALTILLLLAALVQRLLLARATSGRARSPRSDTPNQAPNQRQELA